MGPAGPRVGKARSRHEITNASQARETSRRQRMVMRFAPKLHSRPAGCTIRVVGSYTMNLRCVFHVSPANPAQAKPARSAPAASEVVGITEPQAEQPKPRGRSFETWSRARGWASED